MKAYRNMKCLRCNRKSNHCSSPKPYPRDPSPPPQHPGPEQGPWSHPSKEPVSLPGMIVVAVCGPPLGGVPGPLGPAAITVLNAVWALRSFCAASVANVFCREWMITTVIFALHALIFYHFGKLLPAAMSPIAIDRAPFYQSLRGNIRSQIDYKILFRVLMAWVVIRCPFSLGFQISDQIIRTCVVHFTSSVNARP